MGSLEVQGYLLIDDTHWTRGCKLWHFKTAHFLQWHSRPKQQASLPFSQNQEVKLATESKWPPARALVQTKQNIPRRRPRGSEGQRHSIYSYLWRNVTHSFLPLILVSMTIILNFRTGSVVHLYMCSYATLTPTPAIWENLGVCTCTSTAHL